jgi:hypothetical protein
MSSPSDQSPIAGIESVQNNDGHSNSNPQNSTQDFHQNIEQIEQMHELHSQTPHIDVNYTIPQSHIHEQTTFHIPHTESNSNTHLSSSLTHPHIKLPTHQTPSTIPTPPPTPKIPSTPIQTSFQQQNIPPSIIPPPPSSSSSSSSSSSQSRTKLPPPTSSQTQSRNKKRAFFKNYGQMIDYFLLSKISGEPKCTHTISSRGEGWNFQHLYGQDKHNFSLTTEHGPNWTFSNNFTSVRINDPLKPPKFDTKSTLKYKHNLHGEGQVELIANGSKSNMSGRMKLNINPDLYYSLSAEVPLPHCYEIAHQAHIDYYSQRQNSNQNNNTQNDQNGTNLAAQNIPQNIPQNSQNKGELSLFPQNDIFSDDTNTLNQDGPRTPSPTLSIASTNSVKNTKMPEMKPKALPFAKVGFNYRPSDQPITSHIEYNTKTSTISASHSYTFQNVSKIFNFLMPKLEQNSSFSTPILEKEKTQPGELSVGILGNIHLEEIQNSQLFQPPPLTEPILSPLQPPTRAPTLTPTLTSSLTSIPSLFKRFISLQCGFQYEIPNYITWTGHIEPHISPYSTVFPPGTTLDNIKAIQASNNTSSSLLQTPFHNIQTTMLLEQDKNTKYVTKLSYSPWLGPFAVLLMQKTIGTDFLLKAKLQMNNRPPIVPPPALPLTTTTATTSTPSTSNSNIVSKNNGNINQIPTIQAGLYCEYSPPQTGYTISAHSTYDFKSSAFKLGMGATLQLDKVGKGGMAGVFLGQNWRNEQLQGVHNVQRIHEQVLIKQAFDNAKGLVLNAQNGSRYRTDDSNNGNSGLNDNDTSNNINNDNDGINTDNDNANQINKKRSAEELTKKLLREKNKKGVDPETGYLLPGYTFYNFDTGEVMRVRGE